MKIFKENIAISIFWIIFALDLHTQGRLKANTTLSLNGSVPPCGALMRPLPLRCKSTGKAEPLFLAYYQIFLKMTYTEKKKLSKEGIKAVKAQHTLSRESVIQVISSRSITQLVNDYLTEKDLKNKAYYFILKHGHYDEFVKYSNKQKD